jgi:hypothetical protein
MKSTFVALGLASLALMGCEQSLTVRTSPVTVVSAQPPAPSAVDPAPVQFRVVTRETVDQYLRDQAQSQGTTNPSFVALTVQDLENLVLNISDLRRYIEQQQAVIVYYRSQSR